MPNSLLLLHSKGPDQDLLKIVRLFAIKKQCVGLVSKYPHDFADCVPGGDRGDIVLQWGRVFYVGALLGILALEQACPQPSLFPNGNRGMPLALSYWSRMAHLAAVTNPQALAGHAALIARQLEDGRAFLQGPSPGLADVESWSFLETCRQQNLDLDQVFATARPLGDWFARMSGMETTSISATWSQSVAADNMPGDFLDPALAAKVYERTDHHGDVVVYIPRI